MAEARAKITKAGGADIKRVGHTFSNQFGLTPNAKVRGRSETPTDITFGGS